MHGGVLLIPPAKLRKMIGLSMVTLTKKPFYTFFFGVIFAFSTSMPISKSPKIQTSYKFLGNVGHLTKQIYEYFCLETVSPLPSLLPHTHSFGGAEDLNLPSLIFLDSSPFSSPLSSRRYDIYRQERPRGSIPYGLFFTPFSLSFNHAQESRVLVYP